MKSNKRPIIAVILTITLALAPIAPAALTAYAQACPYTWQDEQGNPHRFIHPRTRLPITPKEAAGLRMVIIERVILQNYAAMEHIPDGATQQQRWLVEYFGGEFGYELTSRLIFGHTLKWFDEFFGNGAAHGIMTGPEFRALANHFGYDLFYEIIGVEDFLGWLTHLFGEYTIYAMQSLPVFPSEDVPFIAGTRLARFERALAQLLAKISKICYNGAGLKF